MKFGHLSTKSSPIGGLVSKDPSFLFSVRNLGKHFQPRKGADRALSNLFKLPRNSVEPFKDDGQTHHVHDLLQREPELEHHGVGLVGHGPLESLVAAHQVVDEAPLVRSTQDYCH